MWVCEEGSEEKINMEETSTSNSLLGSLSVFDSERGSSKEIWKEEVIITRLPPSNQYVYTSGISKNEGTVMGLKGQGCTTREKELYF